VIYAQISSGRKLHLALEAGEQSRSGEVVRAGFLSAPLCGQRMTANYRMTSNLPLGNACKRCNRVYRSRL
jgi:hypothetical protein